METECKDWANKHFGLKPYLSLYIPNFSIRDFSLSLRRMGDYSAFMQISWRFENAIGNRKEWRLEF